ncbi:hypothetical protein CRG98_024487, partial [Punica granatum]
MQSTALALSPSTPFLKPRNQTLILSPIRLPRRPAPGCCCLPSRFDTRVISSLFLALSLRKREVGVKVRATSVPGSASDDGSPKSGAAVRTLQLAVMFGVWYLLNIYFNIYNKQ